MEDFLLAIERSAYAEALRSSFVTYPLVNAAHILSIGAVVSYILLMDAKYLGWTGERPEIDSLLRGLGLGAFILALLTGLSLFAVRATEYADNPAFQIKLGLLAVAGMNLGLFLAIEPRFRRAARMSAGISMILWPAVLVAGRFIGFL